MVYSVIEREQSILCVVDIQERLLPHIHNRDEVARGAGILIRAAGLLEIPALLTEQYPKGLGPTVGEIRSLLPAECRPLEKTTFSCWLSEGFRSAVEHSERNTVVLCGIESHVCVLQTALDLMDAGFRAVVVSDAVGSRAERNYLTALERLRQAGATIATAEMAVMEWLRDAKHPRFKEAQGLIK
jgi:nicotinamidase-related amidase